MENSKLMNCETCDKEISRQAKQCPHCGHDYSKPAKRERSYQGENILNRNRGCADILIIAVILAIGFMIFK